METVDVLTIGAGGGAYPAAFRLARAGLRVIMTDPKGVMSGNCLYEGCVPSKAIRETGVILESQRRFANLGLAGHIQVDYPAIIAHKDTIQSRRYTQHARELQGTPLIQLLKGTARFVDTHTVAVATDEGDRKFHCRHIIIASGADVFVPALPGVELCLTSHDLYKPDPTLKTLPAHMIIIGGGYIGLETASFFAAFGTQVTILQRGPRILSGMDTDMVSTLIPLLHPNIRIVLNAHVTRIETNGTGRRVHYQQEASAQQVVGDVVVMAVGRKPVIPAGATELGIETGKQGVVVGPSLQTSFPHIYAVGDVNGKVPLFHAAVRQSLVAAHNILAGDQPLDYADFQNVPTTVFTLPSAAYMGLTAATAAAQGIEVVTGTYHFTEDARAQILEAMGGRIRLFFAAGSLRLVGGWIVGIDAGHLVGEMGLAVAKGLTAYDLAAFADQHPMSAEGIGKAARSIF
ncbi:MAG: dihydrolipoyl dehydrogenase [Acidiferrobacteraceae bacterium]